jgi:tetratricopeptide (TPR) repeat protein
MEKTTPVISGEDPKRWYQKKNVLIDATVIFAVLLIIGVVWWVGHRPKTEPAPSVPQYSGQSLVDAVNKKYGAHDYGGAIKLIQGQKTVNDRDTQLLLAGAYANSGDDTRSMAIYDAQEKKTALSETDTATAASIAARLKQYQKAIGLYEQAKQRANPKDTDQIAVYQYQIGELQKKL